MTLFADRCLETTTTTGTGTYSLDGASTGYQSLISGAGAGTVSYTVTDGTDWETGIGTLTSGSPDTLSRDTILDSSNAGAAVNWTNTVASTRDVFIAPLAAILEGHVTTNKATSRPSWAAAGTQWIDSTSDPTWTLKLYDGAADISLITIDASANTAEPARGALTSATAQATTSGTSFSFTGIPSWVKRLTMIFNAVSLSGTDNLLIQIGDSGGLESTGYVATSISVDNAGGSAGTSITSGFIIHMNGATNIFSGTLTLNLIDAANTWIASIAGKKSTTVAVFGGGDKQLSGTLDRIALTKTGSDTFDGGSVNIMYD